MYYIYGHVRAIPTYRVYRLYDSTMHCLIIVCPYGYECCNEFMETYVRLIRVYFAHISMTTQARHFKFAGAVVVSALCLVLS